MPYLENTKTFDGYIEKIVLVRQMETQSMTSVEYVEVMALAAQVVIIPKYLFRLQKSCHCGSVMNQEAFQCHCGSFMDREESVFERRIALVSLGDLPLWIDVACAKEMTLA